MRDLHSKGNINILFFYFEDDIPTMLHRVLKNNDGGPRGRWCCLSIVLHPQMGNATKMIFRHLKMELVHIYVLVIYEEIG